MNKYNVLIIGAGGQGSEADQPGSGNEYKIISFAHAFSIHKQTNRLIITDINLQKAKKASNMWDCWYSTSIRTAFTSGKALYPDIAVVTTPDDTHYDILKQLAEYPLKLVIVEKPICTDLQQAREIVEVYKEKEIPLAVNYTRKFIPYYDHLKEYGKPLFGICNFNRGWLHTATHGIDFFDMIGLKDYKILEHKVEPRIWQLMIWFENAIVWKEERFEGDLVWNYYDKSHWHVVENAYNFLEGKESLKCTGEDGLRALEICYELMKGK